MCNVIAFIPARRNSKGIKYKNRQLVDKKTIVEHALDFSKSLPFDEIVLSTDDEYFIDDKKFKDFINLREPDLSGDDIILTDVLLDLISKNQNFKNSFIILLEPTCLFRKKDDLNFFFNENFFKSKYKSFASFKREKIDYSKGWTCIEDEMRPISNPWKRRQEALTYYCLTGHYYGFYANELVNIYPSLLADPCKMIDIENERCIDINSVYDLELVRKKFNE